MTKTDKLLEIEPKSLQRRVLAYKSDELNMDSPSLYIKI